MLQPSGQRVLARLGILDEIASRSTRLEGLQAWLESGRPLIRLRYDALDVDTFAYGVHRGLLFEQLLGLCSSSGVSVQTSSTIASYQAKRDGVDVIDDRGIQHGTFDFVIATDGSRSCLRDASKIGYRCVEYPYAAMWATGPCHAVSSHLHQVIDGTQRLVGLLPIGRGQCSFFWGLRSDQYAALIHGGLQAWKDEVVELSPSAAQLLDSIESFDEITFVGYRHVRMRSWFADRIVFLGDAAHSSSPHLGQGANVALEDAVCFADALDECDNFVLACRQYQTQRWRKLRYYQQLTRLLTPFFQSDIPMLAMGRNVALPWFPRVPWVRKRMLRTLCGDQSGWLRY
jgi:2-polyprenyl-6-methoxyphenol hydroxylase-like FAD-dependent oxidoreductase